MTRATELILELKRNPSSVSYHLPDILRVLESVARAAANRRAKVVQVNRDRSRALREPVETIALKMITEFPTLGLKDVLFKTTRMLPRKNRPSKRFIRKIVKECHAITATTSEQSKLLSLPTRGNINGV